MFEIKGPLMNPKQFGVLSELKKGDVISFRKKGNKNFGGREMLSHIESDSDISFNVHTTHLKTNKNHVRTILPYSKVSSEDYEIQKH